MKTIFKQLILFITLLCFTHPHVNGQNSQVHLSSYELVNGPISIPNISNDLSGVTYNPETGTLFMITNNNSRIYETGLDGQFIRSIILSNANDTEDIVHTGGTTFAIAEERLGEIVYVDIANAGLIDLATITNRSELPGTWGANNGLEGVSYDPATDRIFTVKEKSNINLYNFTKADGNVNPAGCNLGASITPGITDAAAVHHLGLTDGVNAPNGISDRMLVLSQESNVLLEVDENCNEYSRLNGMPGAQIEGVTMDNDGNIYVVGEPNELYIYTPNCRARDSLILLDFKQNIVGLDTWISSQPIDTWQGITLNENGCVKWLELDEAGVSGTISPSLGGLSELTHLDLFRNDFTGPIPPELGNLSSLEVMDLNSNELSGTIPVELSNLTNLLRLNLANNQLTGTIPPELGSYPVLNYLGLGGNQLSGNIPTELGNLTELTRLYLNHNNLTGTIPVEIGDLSKLIYLRLDNNQLTGQIPAEIGQLTDLILLYMHRNQLSGAIPAELGNLVKLVRLYIYTNNLSGNIPPELGNLTNLKYLHLGSNNLTGQLPAELGDLAKLIYLRVSGNDLSGCYDIKLQNLCNQLNTSTNTNAAISNGNNFDTAWEDFCGSMTGVCYNTASCRQIDSLALVDLYNATDGANWEDFAWDLSQPIDTWYEVELNADGCVKWLTLDEQGLTGTLPASLGTMQSLTHLDLFRNNLTGTIPPELGNLSNMQYMDLNHNQFSGIIPIELCNLSNLRRLNLSSNQLTGTIPACLGNLSLMTNISLGANQLSGSIPSELGNLSKLLHLNLNHNQLTGAIPSQLGNLAKLRNLRVDNNQITGQIPPEIGQLGLLTLFYAHRNQLSGAIPAELGNLTNLVRLYLYTNNLSGSIPPEMGNMTNLKYLHLSNNDFTGELPGELGNLTKLIYLRVATNDLSGCYDSNLLNLCNQLNSATNTNSAISNGNNFDTPWESFCTAGYCVQNRVEEEGNNYILQNYPNPFSTSTTIEYNIPEDATNSTLEIFDINGKLVDSKPINQTGTGIIEIQAGTLAPGVYHYRLIMGDAVSATKRMVLTK